MENVLVIGTLLTAIATVALAIATFRLAKESGTMAEANQEAARENRRMVEVNREMLEEMREARIAQEHPQVVVDTDHSKPPLVYVVLRNIGKGAAKDITFDFSAPMEIPEGVNNPLMVPFNDQLYFAQGLDYLAPGAEISCLWGSMPTLAPFLRKQELHNGVTITSRYKSLGGEQYETEWTVNPLLMAGRLSTPEVGTKDLVEAVNQLASDLDQVVSYHYNELQASTESERQQRQD